jgi:hypothetical protein
MQKFFVNLSSFVGYTTTPIEVLVYNGAAVDRPDFCFR